MQARDAVARIDGATGRRVLLCRWFLLPWRAVPHCCPVVFQRSVLCCWWCHLLFQRASSHCWHPVSWPFLVDTLSHGSEKLRRARSVHLALTSPVPSCPAMPRWSPASWPYLAEGRTAQPCNAGHPAAGSHAAAHLPTSSAIQPPGPMPTAVLLPLAGSRTSMITWSHGCTLAKI